MVIATLPTRPRSGTEQPRYGDDCGRVCIPTATRRHGRVLFNQQLWLWGQDIRRPEGNALLTYGFERIRPPEGIKASNTYRLAQADGIQIFLWGFGLLYHRAGWGGIFMPRFAFTPRVILCPDAPENVWSPAQLGNCHPPQSAAQWERARQLFIPALRWITDYERWILTVREPSYRPMCIDLWPKDRIAAERLISEWTSLTDACARGMQQFIAARRPCPGSQ